MGVKPKKKKQQLKASLARIREDNSAARIIQRAFRMHQLRSHDATEMTVHQKLSMKPVFFTDIVKNFFVYRGSAICFTEQVDFKLRTEANDYTCKLDKLFLKHLQTFAQQPDAPPPLKDLNPKYITLLKRQNLTEQEQNFLKEACQEFNDLDELDASQKNILKERKAAAITTTTRPRKRTIIEVVSSDDDEDSDIEGEMKELENDFVWRTGLKENLNFMKKVEFWKKNCKEEKYKSKLSALRELNLKYDLLLKQDAFTEQRKVLESESQECLVKLKQMEDKYGELFGEMQEMREKEQEKRKLFEKEKETFNIWKVGSFSKEREALQEEKKQLALAREALEEEKKQLALAQQNFKKKGAQAVEDFNALVYKRNKAWRMHVSERDKNLVELVHLWNETQQKDISHLDFNKMNN